jgi:hypothetical protein
MVYHLLIRKAADAAATDPPRVYEFGRGRDLYFQCPDLTLLTQFYLVSSNFKQIAGVMMTNKPKQTQTMMGNPNIPNHKTNLKKISKDTKYKTIV